MIEIRPTTVQDAGTIHQLLTALAHDLGKSDEYKGSTDALLTYGFKADAPFHSMIAWEGETALGLIVYFMEFSTWRGKPGVYVQDLYVAASARGKRIGQRLTAAVIHHTRDKGAHYMRLSVHTSNASGAAFYQATGFEASDQETMFVLEGPAFDTLGNLTK